ncbi:twin-arginine translocation signal domain-containing protein [Nonomuraea sp. NPDC048882]|uniref:twin-arginine translocation signal domain-containing protein n=1 Tax=unclassified Nonomuraea TaxID=2593643 RepID=UPI0033EC38B4
MTRRRFLAATGAGTVAGGLLTTSSTVRAMGNSTSRTGVAARDLTQVVLAAFEHHRLMAIGESHGQQEPGDDQQLLLADPRALPW